MSTLSAERRLEGTADAPPSSPAWHPITRIAFRFGVAYLALFCLWMAQITWVFLGVFGMRLPEKAMLWQILALEPVSRWVGEHVFGVDAVVSMSGSGDQAAIWIQVGLLLLVAVLITVVWSVLDRRRPAYPRLGSWALTALRLCVGGQMLFYGFNKLIPSQMQEPGPMALLARVGDLTPMAMLWTQVGSSPAYEIALGVAEVLAGLLLFWPRTATVGAMLSVISMAQVFLLNLTFDVPVKILSGHLLLMGLVLLAPQARRLANFLVLERDSAPAAQPLLFSSPRANRWASAVQVVIGLWVAAGMLTAGFESWREYGGGATKPELYGIWEVGEFTIDGIAVPPLTTDPTRWQRLVVDLGSAGYQRMDDTIVPVLATTDPATKTMTLTAAPTGPAESPQPYASFTMDRTSPGTLTLHGELGGRPATVTLERLDLDRFPLRGTDFRWVQNQPRFS